MLKALKIVVIIWAALGILFGLGFVFAPEQLGDMFGFEQGPAYVAYFLAMLGVSWIAVGAFTIVAMTRDILRNLLWVQLAITSAILFTAVKVYSMLMGFITFSQEGVGLIITAVFAVALLALYPWGRTAD